ncbi:MAG: hypothetical protein H7Y43_08345 [Akkermansiaceae bacterium]|nr:hypothetical protein [Verrucomicrobiales bacterium]
MRVESNSPVPDPLKATAARAKAPEAAVEKNAADFAASTQLSQALEHVPLVRADKVAAAKALVASPDYPNEAVLRQVARTLADNLKPQQS